MLGRHGRGPLCWEPCLARRCEGFAEGSAGGIVEFPFLLGVGGPSFAAVQQCIEDASVAHCHLCFRGEFGALPDACGEAGKRRCSLPNTFVELHVQRQVVRDG